MAKSAAIEVPQKLVHIASIEDILTALTTLPVSPASAQLDFHADGIPWYSADDRNHAQYRAQCDEHGVIPYSRIELKAEEGFYPEWNSGIISGEPDKKSAVLSNLIKGGRVHWYDISWTQSDSYLKPFEMFKRSVLPLLINNSYQLSRADIVLATHTKQVYSEGDPNGETDIDEGYVDLAYEDVVLTAERTKNNFGRIEITFSEYAKSGKAKQILAWYRGLKSKK